jgi:hypothetical protein
MSQFEGKIMLFEMKFIVQVVLLFIVLPVLLLMSFVSFSPVFGGKPDTKSYQRIVQSMNFNGEHFDNLVPTAVSTRTADSPSFLESINLIFFSG